MILAVGTAAGPFAQRWTIDDPVPVVLDRGDAPEDFYAQAVAWSPDGGRIALAGNSDGAEIVVVLDAGSLQVLDLLVDPDCSWCPSFEVFHPSRPLLVTGHEHTVNFWTLSDRPARRRRRRPDNTEACAFTPDGRYLIEAESFAGLRRLDVDTWEEVAMREAPYHAVFPGAAGSEVVAVRSGGEVEIWDVEIPAVVSTTSCEQGIEPSGFAPRTGLLARSDHRSCALLDVQTGRLVHRIALESRGEHTGQVFTPDGRHLLIYGHDTRLFEVTVR